MRSRTLSAGDSEVRSRTLSADDSESLISMISGMPARSQRLRVVRRGAASETVAQQNRSQIACARGPRCVLCVFLEPLLLSPCLQSVGKGAASI